MYSHGDSPQKNKKERKMNILAVDDEHLALRMLESAIKEAVTDATLYLCDEPSLALESAKKVPIDVAFLDIHMAGMDGVRLAKALKDIRPETNIIFATGFAEHMAEGFALHASGYLLKPVSVDAVRTEMANLRHPIAWEAKSKLQVRTFGNFDVFYEGRPLKFERKQAKEILAYLIDKRGTSVSYAELASVIFEDEDYDRTHQKNLQVYVASLVKTLHSIGQTDLILKNRQGILVNTAKVDCDYYRFLEGDARAVNAFTGQYMSAYSWAEFTVGYLERQMEK